MTKKGFTLIELMGVIIILGILILIATPAIRKVTSASKDELYDIQINNIKDGLKNWAIDNSRILPQNEGETIIITLGQLKMGGYVDLEIRNPKNNKCFGNDMTLEITRYQKNYIYNVNTDSGTETSVCDDYKKPYMILKGNALTYVEINDTYVDEGVIVRDALGNDITGNVSTVITGSGTTIDTSKIGNEYTITYSVTVDGETSSIKRTVIARDTIAPTLTIPEDTTIGTGDTTFDVMEGVSATDNSGENVEIEVKSNISFGIPGDYKITYTAKDSSGNEAVKERIIKTGEIVHRHMTSNYSCIKNNNICQNGTEINVAVNDSETYKFYVINDTGNELTLIMDGNLGNNVAWVNASDYNKENNKDDEPDSCEYTSCTDEGPITVINALKERTDNWNNIEERLYTYSDDGGGDKYASFDMNMRARLLTYTEATSSKIGCEFNVQNTCPSYLKNGLRFWFSSAFENEFHTAYYINTNGLLVSGIVYDAWNFGVRPVITILK